MMVVFERFLGGKPGVGWLWVLAVGALLVGCGAGGSGRSTGLEAVGPVPAGTAVPLAADPVEVPVPAGVVEPTAAVGASVPSPSVGPMPNAAASPTVAASPTAVAVATAVASSTVAPVEGGVEFCLGGGSGSGGGVGYSGADTGVGDGDASAGPGGGLDGCVGPVGVTGTDVLPGPGDVVGALWDEPLYSASVYGSSVAQNSVYDMCDDAQVSLLANASGQHPLSDSDGLDSRAVERIYLRDGVSCEPGGNRYRYVADSWVSPAMASVDELLAWPSVAAHIRGLKIWPGGELLGTSGHSIESFSGRRFPLEDSNEVVVYERLTSVRGGAVRGMVWNQSRALFARDVTITVRSTAEGEAALSGTVEWPLTVQPGEMAPFEISGWAGTADAEKLVFDIDAHMSAYIDLTRSFRVSKGPSPYDWVEGVYLDEAFYREKYPDFVIDGQDQQIPDGRFYLDEANVSMHPGSSHPSLRDEWENLTIENIRAFAGFFDEFGVADVVELIPYKTRREGYDRIETLPLRVDPAPPLPGHPVITRITGFELVYISNFGDPEVRYAIGVWVGGDNNPDKQQPDPAPSGQTPSGQTPSN